jgi:hypothetical protein
VVLIESRRHHETVLGFLLITLLLLLGPLAALAGVDSRVDETARRRLGH